MTSQPDFMFEDIEDDDDLVPFDSVSFDADEIPAELRLISSTLKPPVRFGVCLWWSEQSPWIHPQDHEIAESFVPGNRVFRRDECENVSDQQLGYSRLSYGDIKFRVLPAIWMEVDYQGFELGDLVEIRSQQGRLRPGIAVISDIEWNRLTRRIEYSLEQNDVVVGRSFVASDIQPAVRLGSHLSSRELNSVTRLR